MKKLDREELLKKFVYDKNTGFLYRRFSKGLRFAGELHSSGYLSVTFNYATHKVHRIIMALNGFDIDGMVVDHKDGDKLNNKLSNLRVVTQSENSRNQKMRSNNTSGYNGVHYHSKSKKFRATIGANGERITIGYYDSIEDAIKARNIAMRKIGGFTRRHGKPEDDHGSIVIPSKEYTNVSPQSELFRTGSPDNKSLKRLSGVRLNRKKK